MHWINDRRVGVKIFSYVIENAAMLQFSEYLIQKMLLILIWGYLLE